jgi:hypothetical protein
VHDEPTSRQHWCAPPGLTPQIMEPQHAEDDEHETSSAWHVEWHAPDSHTEPDAHA